MSTRLNIFDKADYIKNLSHDNSKVYAVIIYELLSLEKKLRGYCHDESCKNIYECPTLHDACKGKLELDTSIAWRAGDCIKWYVEHHEDKNQKEIKYRFIEDMIMIVRRHYAEYYELCGLLEEVGSIMLQDSMYLKNYYNKGEDNEL